MSVFAFAHSAADASIVFARVEYEAPEEAAADAGLDTAALLASTLPPSTGASQMELFRKLAGYAARRAWINASTTCSMHKVHTTKDDTNTERGGRESEDG